ncbi:hypothetical protein FB45DRAFT_1059207 [Roridomyces roridus]|uniref:F-box domain-containing protein n=1 Tax=Roridomyces roridus TaxID=1738132 RepID=A0AAD7BRH2_9AGAR|nr:hypothetical protein FB45DRAFT_1059207 [Roridomyces roridus]
MGFGPARNNATYAARVLIEVFEPVRRLLLPLERDVEEVHREVEGGEVLELALPRLRVIRKIQSFCLPFGDFASFLLFNVSLTQEPPILRLPNEILVEIAVAGQRADWESQPDDLFTTELALSQLCRRFRHAITSAPELWTRVHVDLSSQDSINLSRLYLERSATQKISITLDVHHSESTSREAVDSHLTPHITRITRLYIEFESYFDLKTALASLRIIQLEWPLDAPLGPPVHFPCLQHFELEGLSEMFGSHTNYDLLEHFFAFEAPRLCSLALTRCSLGSHAPWMSTLTRVELRHGAALVDPDSDIFEDVTIQLPALTHLRADLKELYYSYEHGIVSNCLTYLQLKIIDDSGPDTAALLRIFSSFNTPALTHLDLHGTHGDQIALLFNSTNQPLRFPALTSLSFVTRSKDDLRVCRQLEEDWGLDDEDIRISAPPVHLFPALSSLTLVYQCFTPRILRETLGRSSLPWPSLQTIVLWPRKRELEETDKAVREIARWKQEQEEQVPKFRLCPELFRREWLSVEVELVDKISDLDA